MRKRHVASLLSGCWVLGLSAVAQETPGAGRVERISVDRVIEVRIPSGVGGETERAYAIQVTVPVAYSEEELKTWERTESMNEVRTPPRPTASVGGETVRLIAGGLPWVWYVAAWKTDVREGRIRPTVRCVFLVRDIQLANRLPIVIGGEVLPDGVSAFETEPLTEEFVASHRVPNVAMLLVVERSIMPEPPPPGPLNDNEFRRPPSEDEEEEEDEPEEEPAEVAPPPPKEGVKAIYLVPNGHDGVVGIGDVELWHTYEHAFLGRLHMPLPFFCVYWKKTEEEVRSLEELCPSREEHRSAGIPPLQVPYRVIVGVEASRRSAVEMLASPHLPERVTGLRALRWIGIEEHLKEVLRRYGGRGGEIPEGLADQMRSRMREDGVADGNGDENVEAVLAIRGMVRRVGENALTSDERRQVASLPSFPEAPEPPPSDERRTPRRVWEPIPLFVGRE